MDAVPQKANPIVSLNFIWGLFVAMSLCIVQEWLGFKYYDEIREQWLPPFHLSVVRFGMRETVVYLNLWTGYAMLTRMHPNTPLPVFFAIFTIVLDVFFVFSGVSRLVFPNFTPLIKQYGSIFYYINSGILFVFFHALGVAWPTLNTSLLKEK